MVVFVLLFVVTLTFILYKLFLLHVVRYYELKLCFSLEKKNIILVNKKYSLHFFYNTTKLIFSIFTLTLFV